MQLWLSRVSCLCQAERRRERDLQICPKLGSSVSPVQVTVPPSVGVQSAVIVHDVDDIQPMPLANFIVIWVMCRSDLQGACAKLSVHIVICNDTDAPVKQPAQIVATSIYTLLSSKPCKCSCLMSRYTCPSLLLPCPQMHPTKAWTPPRSPFRVPQPFGPFCPTINAWHPPPPCAPPSPPCAQPSPPHPPLDA